MTTDAMLEHAANYLLNHCFVLGSVEDQRADYLYIQDHLDQVRAVFAPLGYRVVLYPAPLQAAALVNEHEGSQARLLKYESILLLVLRLLYLQKRESLDTAAEQVLVTVEEVQAELQKMNLPRRLDPPALEKLLRTLRRYNLARPIGRPSGCPAGSRSTPRYCWPCRMPPWPKPLPRWSAPAPSLGCMSGRTRPRREKNDRAETSTPDQLAQL